MIGWVGSRWVPRGHVRVPHGPAWVRISVAHRYGTVESSVRARRVPTIEPRRVPTDFCLIPDLARGDQMELDGSLDCPILVHD